MLLHAKIRCGNKEVEWDQQVYDSAEILMTVAIRRIDLSAAIGGEDSATLKNHSSRLQDSLKIDRSA